MNRRWEAWIGGNMYRDLDWVGGLNRGIAGLRHDKRLGGMNRGGGGNGSEV